MYVKIPRSAELLGAAALLAWAAPAADTSFLPNSATRAFNALGHRYLNEVHYRFSPSAATADGLHEFDNQLEDYSPAGRQKQISTLNAWEKKISAVNPAGLSADAAGDREILLNSIRGDLLDLEVIRTWEKNPGFYSEGVARSINSIVSREYAPADTRLRAVIQREKQIPRVFVWARRSLKSPAKVYTELALSQIESTVSFFRNAVPQAFATAGDARAKAEFAQANAAVVRALEDYYAWVKADALPNSNGDFRYGTDTYRKALAYREMVDTPLERLLQLGYDDLRLNQSEFARLTRELDPDRTPQQELAALQALHPPADGLLKAFRDQFESEIVFIQQHGLITLPPGAPEVVELPAFLRDNGYNAAMDVSGPFEKQSVKALLSVPVPGSNWTAERTEEHLATFNFPAIVAISIHEAYPGHYVQLTRANAVPSEVRRAFQTNSTVEGWAQYAEQMMFEEGFARPTPGATPEQQRQIRTTEMGMLQNALLGDACLITAIRMHTGVGGAMSVDEAAEFFVKEGYQSAASARGNALRGTFDALDLYYAMGKLAILKLRGDYRRQQDTAFSLKEFNDTFVSQGSAPIKIIRRALLRNDSPVL